MIYVSTKIGFTLFDQFAQSQLFGQIHPPFSKDISISSYNISRKHAISQKFELILSLVRANSPSAFSSNHGDTAKHIRLSKLNFRQDAKNFPVDETRTKIRTNKSKKNKKTFLPQYDIYRLLQKAWRRRKPWFSKACQRQYNYHNSFMQFTNCSFDCL